MRVTWYGHSAFRVEVKESVVLIDPFLTGNPSFSGEPADAFAGCTHLVLTHGHDDHIGDAVALIQAHNPQVVANFEICMWLGEQGAENLNPGNTGGTVDCGDFAVSFTQAQHSSGTRKDGESIYLGNPLGVVLSADGEPSLYHMGDTDVFGDMALINELYRPKVGIVPIGDRFTMGARGAALACNRFFNFDKIIPCHYGSFPIIDATADAFLAEMGDGASKVFVPTIGKAFDV